MASISRALAGDSHTGLAMADRGRFMAGFRSSCSTVPTRARISMASAFGVMARDCLGALAMTAFCRTVGTKSHHAQHLREEGRLFG